MCQLILEIRWTICGKSCSYKYILGVDALPTVVTATLAYGEVLPLGGAPATVAASSWLATLKASRQKFVVVNVFGMQRRLTNTVTRSSYSRVHSKSKLS